MENDDIKYRQGRSKKQWESNEMVAMWSFASLIGVFLVIILINIFK